MQTRHAPPSLLMILGSSVLASLVLGFASPASAAGQVHVVDPAGGAGVFLDVTAAVGAASDGDTVLVRPGWYPTVTINGRGVTVLADGAGVSFGLLDVRNTTATQAVTVRGCSVSGSLFSNQFPVRVWGCQGPVVLEDLAVEPPLGSPALVDHAVWIKDSNRVKVVRCTITASRGTSGSNGAPGSPGGAGIHCEGSSVGVYDCVVTGGDGGDAELFFFTILTSTAAGPGLWVRDGQVLASGSSFTGGKGGNGSQTSAGLCNLPSSDGGDGVSLVPSGHLTRIDCQTTAGAAGTDPAGCPGIGVPGVAVDFGASGVLSSVNETARSLEVSSPAREGQTVTLSVEGVPNETTFLLVSATVHAGLELGLSGLLLPGTPLGLSGLAPLDGSGQLQATLPVPTGFFPPGVFGANFYLQVAVPGSAGTGLLGSGTVVTLLALGF